MSFTLQPLSYQQLLILAASQMPTEFASRAAVGALPPDFVAVRALTQLQAGKSAFWCSTFVITRNADQVIVGSCGFKHEPQAGRVEIGYSISSDFRRQGIASAMLTALLELAFAHGATEVLAEILPTNTASIATVKKAGFKNIGTRIDDDNETVQQWIAIKQAK
ncbi:GNAT family N-acetyltransferase [Undibacterium sp. Di24W]|uniref:GNAT family N-acetyltransferase n=1 Tax=Undibacterium sp. Di24W TaxID=3413033 RepID=UPI003BF0A02A